MSIALQIIFALASVAVLIGLMAIVRRQARAMDWSAEVQRKLVHIGTGLYAITLPWLFPDRWPVLMLLGVTVVVMLVLRMPRFAKGGVGEALHGVERRSYGDLLLALAVGVVFLLSDGVAILYVLPLAILTLSDAAAALTGSAYGRKFFAVEDGMKSLEGSVAFFMVSFALSMICLLVLSDTPRLNVIYLAAIVAAFGTLVEADSWRGFDNFFLPACLMVFLEAHLQTPPMELFFIMAVFLGAIAAALIVAPMLGVPRHTARVYVTASFVLLVVVDPANAALPILAFVAHYLSQRANPDDASHPELDCVATVALISFFWLVLGQVSGAFNLSLFGLTAMGLCIGFVTLASSDRRVATLLGLGMAGAGVLLYAALMAGNSTANAIPVSWLVAGLAAGLAFVVPVIRPEFFQTYRAMRVGLLVMAAPLAIFALEYPRLGG